MKHPRTLESDRENKKSKYELPEPEDPIEAMNLDPES